MKGILADVNIQGQMGWIHTLVTGPKWNEFWSWMGLVYLTFPDVGLTGDTKDVDIWRLCQEQELVLVTGNRNHEGPDSLEEAIRRFSTAGSLPVFTVADPDALCHSQSYAERVAEKLVERLMDIETFRGTGRIFIP